MASKNASLAMSWSYLHLLLILMSLFKTLPPSPLTFIQAYIYLHTQKPTNSKFKPSQNMSTNIIFLSKFLLLLILLLNPHEANNTRGCSTFVCVAGARPLEHNVPKYINLKPHGKSNGKRGFAQGGGVEACLPKGFRRSSAPSRYINYQPLGSTCSSSKVVNNNGPRA